MNNYVIINGKIIYEKDLTHYYPFSIVNNSTTLKEVVKIIVNEIIEIKSDCEKYPVYLNLLISKSKQAKNIAAIIELSHKCEISQITVDYFDDAFIRLLKGKPKIYNKVPSRYLDKKEILTSFKKYVANHVFRFLGYFVNKGCNNSSQTKVIRAWVDIDEKLHKTHFIESDIFVYPFGLNLKRSYLFIKKLKEEHPNYKLIGIEYSLIDLITYFIRLNALDSVVNFEYNAMKKHSKKFKKYSSIYTSDDFQAGVPILYSNLNNAYIQNKAHGLGCYNLFTNYSEFYVFNDSQKNFYSEMASKTIFYTYEHKKFFEHGKKNKFRIVYIDQGNLLKFGYQYEQSLQEKILASLNKLILENNINVYVKFHPNRSKDSIDKFINDNHLLEQEKIKEDEQYLFINLYSTSYYDFSRNGRFLFIKDNYFDPRHFFGADIDTIRIEDLKQTVLNYEY